MYPTTTYVVLGGFALWGCSLLFRGLMCGELHVLPEIVRGTLIGNPATSATAYSAYIENNIVQYLRCSGSFLVLGLVSQ